MAKKSLNPCKHWIIQKDAFEQLDPIRCTKVLQIFLWAHLLQTYKQELLVERLGSKQFRKFASDDNLLLWILRSPESELGKDDTK